MALDQCTAARWSPGRFVAQAGTSATPGPMAASPRRSIRRAGGHELGLEPLIRAGHALSVRGLVLSDSGQAGAGVIEPGLAALGQGLAALPQGQGVLQRDGTRLEALHDGHQLLSRPLITE